MPSNGLSSLLWFAFVVLAIPLLLWLLKRTPLGGAGSGQAPARTVGVLALSPSQKLVTVEVGSGDARQWLLLGVTPNGIRTLHTMPPGEGPVPPAPGSNTAPGAGAASGFAAVLDRLRRPGGDRDAR